MKKNTLKNELCEKEIQKLLRSHTPMSEDAVPRCCLTEELTAASTTLCILMDHNNFH